jgi:hypothetical protein
LPRGSARRFPEVKMTTMSEHPYFVSSEASGPSFRPTIHVGPSMYPALRDRDVLQLVAYGGRRPKRGDVIVFHSPEDGGKVTHRVISVAGGIRTRGDSNSEADPGILGADRIVGRVVALQRRGRRLRVRGGWRALLLLRLRRAIAGPITAALLHPSYRLLSRSGLPRLWLPAKWRARVVRFERPEGTELHVMIGRRLAGYLRPGKNEWVIRRPFRLLVNEASLPGGGVHGRGGARS